VIVLGINGQRWAALLVLLMFDMLANDNVCAGAEFAAAWCDPWDSGGRSDDVANNAAGGRRTLHLRLEPHCRDVTTGV
jgi:hypothetical protein